MMFYTYNLAGYLRSSDGSKIQMVFAYIRT
jgi:hypothetical protein